MSGRALKRTVLLFLLVVSAILLSGGDLYSRNDTFDKLILTLKQKVDEWNRMAYLSLALILVSGISGLVVSTIQQMKGKWVKTTTIILGIVIGGSVLINNAICEYDYKTLKYYVNRGRNIIDKIQLYSYDYHKCPRKENREAIQNKIMALSEEIYKIDDVIYKKPGSDESLAGSFVMGQCLYAETADRLRPDWISHLPVNDGSKYFTGRAGDPLLTNAEKKSYNDAFEQARAYIRNTINQDVAKKNGIDTADIENVMLKSCLKEDYYFEMSGEKEYVYYTLLRIRIEMLRSNITVYKMLSKSTIPDDLIEIR